MVRALGRDLGRHDVAPGVKVPRHKAGPPETLSEIEYENLLCVPDRRSVRGKRDYARLRCWATAGCAPPSCAASSPKICAGRRANAWHRRLFVRGKGAANAKFRCRSDAGRARDVAGRAFTGPSVAGCATSSLVPPARPLPRRAAARAALAQAVHKLVRGWALAAGVPQRLAHPHALRIYWATSLLEDGVPIHRVSSRLGHADLRTTSRYADHPDHGEDIADVLDRRHRGVTTSTTLSSRAPRRGASLRPRPDGEGVRGLSRLAPHHCRRLLLLGGA